MAKLNGENIGKEIVQELLNKSMAGVNNELENYKNELFQAVQSVDKTQNAAAKKTAKNLDNNVKEVENAFDAAFKKISQMNFKYNKQGNMLDFDLFGDDVKTVSKQIKSDINHLKKEVANYENGIKSIQSDVNSFQVTDAKKSKGSLANLYGGFVDEKEIEKSVSATMNMLNIQDKQIREVVENKLKERERLITAYNKRQSTLTYEVGSKDKNESMIKNAKEIFQIGSIIKSLESDLQSQGIPIGDLFEFDSSSFKNKFNDFVARLFSEDALKKAFSKQANQISNNYKMLFDEIKTQNTFDVSLDKDNFKQAFDQSAISADKMTESIKQANKELLRNGQISEKVKKQIGRLNSGDSLKLNNPSSFALEIADATRHGTELHELGLWEDSKSLAYFNTLLKENVQIRETVAKINPSLIPDHIEQETIDIQNQTNALKNNTKAVKQNKKTKQTMSGGNSMNTNGAERTAEIINAEVQQLITGVNGLKSGYAFVNSPLAELIEKWLVDAIDRIKENKSSLQDEFQNLETFLQEESDKLAKKQLAELYQNQIADMFGSLDKNKPKNMKDVLSKIMDGTITSIDEAMAKTVANTDGLKHRLNDVLSSLTTINATYKSLDDIDANSQDSGWLKSRIDETQHYLEMLDKLEQQNGTITIPEKANKLISDKNANSNLINSLREIIQNKQKQFSAILETIDLDKEKADRENKYSVERFLSEAAKIDGYDKEQDANSVKYWREQLKKEAIDVDKALEHLQDNVTARIVRINNELAKVNFKDFLSELNIDDFKDSNALYDLGNSLASRIGVGNISFEDAVNKIEELKKVSDSHSSSDAVKQEKEEVENLIVSNDRNNQTLAEKLEYLKEIQKFSKFMDDADERRMSMEDKAYDVGGNNPKSEADSLKKIQMYEDLCEKIQTADAALDDFSQTYDRTIVTMKDGSTVEITDLWDLDGLKLLKSQITDIKFVPFEDIEPLFAEESVNTDKAQKEQDELQEELVATRQEAEKTAAKLEDVGYHAGIISKLNKAETNGQFYGNNRGTGYYGTGHYFVDAATRHELDNNSSYSKLPYTSVDISMYDNLFKATTDEVAGKLHEFLRNITRFTQGVDKYNISELFAQFKGVFEDTVMSIDDFEKTINELTIFMQNSDGFDRSDSVSTQFMKSLGYGGVDTRGTKYADTRYGTVIYDLKEESILQANITDELQKQGDMLERLNYHKGEVFDQSVDDKIQKQLDQQSYAKEVSKEAHRLFDDTNLTKYQDELVNVSEKLKRNQQIIYDCQRTVDDAEHEAHKVSRQNEQFGLSALTDKEQRQLADSMKKSYQDRINELTKENELLSRQKALLEEIVDDEEKVAHLAYETAKQNVDNRRNGVDVGSNQQELNIEKEKLAVIEQQHETQKKIVDVELQQLTRKYKSPKVNGVKGGKNLKDTVAMRDVSLHDIDYIDDDIIAVIAEELAEEMRKEASASSTATATIVEDQKEQKQAFDETAKAAEDKADRVKKAAQVEVDSIVNNEEKTIDQKIKALEGKILTGNKAIAGGKKTADDWQIKIPLMEQALNMLKEQKAEEIRISEEKKKQAAEQAKLNALNRQYESDNYVLKQTGRVGDDDGWAYTEQFGTAQTQRVTYRYDEDAGDYIESRAPEYTNFKGLTSAFKQGYETLKQMEYQLNKLKTLHGEAFDSSALDHLIKRQKEYVYQLLEEGRSYGQNSDYVMEYRQFVEDTRDIASTTKYKYQHKQNIDNAKDNRGTSYKAASDSVIKLDDLKRKLSNSNLDAAEYDDLVSAVGKITLLEERCNEIKKDNQSLTKQEIVDLQEQVKLVENDVKGRIEANKIATQLTASSQDDAKRDYGFKIDKFVEKLKEAKFDTQSLQKAAQDLKTTLASVSDKKGMTDVIAQFKTLGYNFDYYKEKHRASDNQYKGLYAVVKEYQEAHTKLNALYAQEAKSGSSNELVAKIDIQKKKVAELKQEAKDAAFAILEMFKAGSITDSQKTDAIHLIRNINTGKDDSTSILSGALDDRSGQHSTEITDITKKYEKLGYTVEEIANKFASLNDAQANVEKTSNDSVDVRLENELKYQEELEKLTMEAAQIKSGTKQNDSSAVKNALDTTTRLMSQIQSKQGNNIIGFDKLFGDAQEKISKLNGELSTGTSNIEQYTKKIQGIANNLNNVVRIFDTDDVDAAKDVMHQYAQSLGIISKEEYNSANGITTLKVKFEEQNGQVREAVFQYNEADKALRKISDTTKTATNSLQSFMNSLKNRAKALVQYLMTFASFYRIVAWVRQGVTVIRELDGALTEMRKVSDETTESLKNFQKASFDIAESIGATAVQIQQSSADFMRLGYSLQEAAKLAEDANIYANVGDMDIEEATEHMISSIKAWESEFESEVAASEAIVDRYNEIGNNFAISSADIGAAMERSAAALKAGGNTLNEALGLITAGNIIQQDAETTAAALKIMSLRIRGSKADLEEMGESTDGLVTSTSKLREQIKGLTGVDIMLDENTYKSTAQIVQELGAVYNQLTDIQQANLLEIIAGKNRASTVEGLLQNYEVISDVIKAAEGAEGSALIENEKRLESIQGRIDLFTNRLQEFWSTALNSDLVKEFVDAGTQLINILDNVLSGLTKTGTLNVVTEFLSTAINLLDRLTSGLGEFSTVLAGAGIFKLFKFAKGKGNKGGGRVKTSTLIICHRAS